MQNTRAGWSNRNGRTAVNSYRIQRGRHISRQAGEWIALQVFSGAGFREIGIEQAKNKDMMVRRPCITNHGRIACNHLKSVGACWIDGPEMSVTDKSNFITA